MKSYLKWLIAAVAVIAAVIVCVICANGGEKQPQPSNQPVVTATASEMPTVEPTVEPTEAPQEVKLEKPWENGGKAVSEYTWAEYEALSPELKEAFFDAFESVNAFDAWRKTASAAKNEGSKKPWENGGKAVNKYTWEEYEALSPELKEAFFDAFKSVSAFEKWRKAACGEEDESSKNPWENGGKAVTEYTWEEYEALSPELKETFFDAFKSVEAFEAWREDASGENDEGSGKTWKDGGKAVSEYTWAEYEALSPALKEEFFDAFESVEAFDKWMKGARNGQ